MSDWDVKVTVNMTAPRWNEQEREAFRRSLARAAEAHRQSKTPERTPEEEATEQRIARRIKYPLSAPMAARADETNLVSLLAWAKHLPGATEPGFDDPLGDDVAPDATHEERVRELRRRLRGET